MKTAGGEECQGLVINDTVVILSDTGGVIDFVSQSASRLWHGASPGFRGKHISDLLQPVDHPAFNALLADIVNARRSCGTLVVKLATTAGSAVLHAEPCQTVDGKVTGCLLLFRITEPEPAPAQIAGAGADDVLSRVRLSQLERVTLANHLATGIAHELNQPLTTIGTYARIGRDQLQHSTTDHAALSTLLDRIGQQAGVAAEIIKSLSGLIGESRADPVEVNINRLIEHAVDLARDDLASINVELECVLDETLPSVKVVYIQIQQVLLNLIRNSRDAMAVNQPHPRITVETKRFSDDRVMVVVRDNGDGVAIEHAKHIFEPFYSTRSSGTNMGLGLTICKSIIKQHGGELDLNTLYKEGAEFYFTLPLAMYHRSSRSDH